MAALTAANQMPGFFPERDPSFLSEIISSALFTDPAWPGRSDIYLLQD